MKTYFYSIGKDSRIDEENGIIRGVSLIKTGDAEGHFDNKGRQETVDETTLQQVYNYCKGAESIKVKADHGSGVLSTIGYVDNFSLTKDKVLGDFHVYESESQKPRIFEIAKKNPEHMGMSLEFEGKDEAKDNKSFSRCERVLAVALVSDPAANKSLFSREDNPQNKQPEDPINMDPEKDKPEDDLGKKYEELAKKFEELETKYAKKFGEDEPDGDEDGGDDVVVDDAGKSEDVAVDPNKQPAGSDPEKTYSEDDVKKIAEMAAKNVIKHFAANVGTVHLGKPGNGGTPTKEKHFEEFVADKAASDFKGDHVAARAHILTNFAKYPDAKKAYEATRNVKHS